MPLLRTFLYIIYVFWSNDLPQGTTIQRIWQYKVRAAVSLMGGTSESRDIKGPSSQWKKHKRGMNLVLRHQQGGLDEWWWWWGGEIQISTFCLEPTDLDSGEKRGKWNQQTQNRKWMCYMLFFWCHQWYIMMTMIVLMIVVILSMIYIMLILSDVTLT